LPDKEQGLRVSSIVHVSDAAMISSRCQQAIDTWIWRGRRLPQTYREMEFRRAVELNELRNKHKEVHTGHTQLSDAPGRAVEMTTFA
jgi:uncharacterized membrane protein